MGTLIEIPSIVRPGFVDPNHRLAEGLAGCWAVLPHTAGNSLIDLSGNGNDGVPIGIPYAYPDSNLPVKGILGTYTNGGTAMYYVPDNGQFKHRSNAQNAAGGVTLAIWVRGNIANHLFFGRKDNAQTGGSVKDWDYAMYGYIDGNGSISGGTGNGAGTARWSEKITLQSYELYWQQFIMVLGLGNGTMYRVSQPSISHPSKVGVEVISTWVDYAYDDKGGILHIGGEAAVGTATPTALQDDHAINNLFGMWGGFAAPAMWNRALTADDVQAYVEMQQRDFTEWLWHPRVMVTKTAVTASKAIPVRGIARATRVRQNHPLAKGLELFWKPQPHGLTADLSGKGRHGTLSGATPIYTNEGIAFDFDGSNDTITFPMPETYSNGVSFAAIWRGGNPASNGNVFQDGTGSTFIRDRSDGTFSGNIGGDFISQSPTFSVDRNEWHVWVISYIPSRGPVSWQGPLRGRITDGPYDTGPDATNRTIGDGTDWAIGGPAFYFAGDILAFAVWDYAIEESGAFAYIESARNHFADLLAPDTLYVGQAAAGGATNYNVSALMSMSMTDSPVGAFAMLEAIAEAMGFSDSTTGALQMLVAVSEAASLSDTSTGVLGAIIVEISDTLALMDTAAMTTLGITASTTEALALSDASGAVMAYMDNLAATLNLSDANATLQAVQEAATFVMSLADTPTEILALYASVSETLSLSDTVASVTAQPAYFTAKVILLAAFTASFKNASE